MKEIYFSIIIPVYNVESYLRRCMNSMLNQSFTNYEIILIDDGSTDSSGKICDEYSHINEKVQAIHQKNKGVSSARNAGLSVAKGKYIVFADSDDFVERDLLLSLANSSADLVLVGSQDFQNGKTISRCIPDNEKWEMNSSESIKKLLDMGLSGSVWGKRYRRDIIYDKFIHFNEKINYCEDRLFNNDYILNVNSIESINRCEYFRCLYEHDTLTSKSQTMDFNTRNMWRKIAYEQYKDYPEIQKIYIDQTLYFSEMEFMKISHSNLPFNEKSNAIKTIISDDFFIKAITRQTNAFSKIVRLFCIKGWSGLIALKYSS